MPCSGAVRDVGQLTPPLTIEEADLLQAASTMVELFQIPLKGEEAE